MASNSSDAFRAPRALLEKTVKQLLNSDLKNILKHQGLPVSGVKAALQDRIITDINEAVTSEDAARFTRLYSTISGFNSKKLPDLQLPGSNTSTNTMAGVSSSSNPSHRYTGPGNSFSNSYQNIAITAMFKKSPFYEIREKLGPTVTLPALHASRSTSTLSITLNQEHVSKMASDTEIKVMAYCSVDMEPSPKDVAFPNQCELRCNDEIYPGNLRGIKKKPGTTKPADITSFLRKISGFKNVLSITYAATDKRYTLAVYFVRKASVEQLVQRIKAGNVFTKQSVVLEMKKQAEDDEVVATSVKMPLKCPLSGMRIQLPCRSTRCNHNQCFDATSFLQLQEQAPQWQCPICNNTFGFDALVVDQFVEDILRNTPSNTEQVTIEPDGTWSLQSDTPSRQQNGRPSDMSTSSASNNKRKLPDVFDLDGPSNSGYKSNGFRSGSHTTLTPQPHSTQTLTSREPSTAASALSRSASKRPVEEVIDLTLSSDDEDDEPPRRPMKRASTGSYLNAAAQPTNLSTVQSQSDPKNPGAVYGSVQPPKMPSGWSMEPQQQSTPTPALKSPPLRGPSWMPSPASTLTSTTIHQGYNVSHSTSSPPHGYNISSPPQGYSGSYSTTTPPPAPFSPREPLTSYYTPPGYGASDRNSYSSAGNWRPSYSGNP